MTSTTYTIGVMTTEGGMYWTGSAWSTTVAEARQYPTSQGARCAIRRIEKRTGKYMDIIADSRNGEYFNNEEWLEDWKSGQKFRWTSDI
jgi:hypothetical protein